MEGVQTLFYFFACVGKLDAFDRSDRRSVDDKKVTDHHALIVTEKDEDNDDSVTLPALRQGETFPLQSAEPLEKQTKPRPLHTESSLLSAMENCGNSVEDAELRAGLKEAGIGTPATRASVIETLFSRDYMRREKKNGNSWLTVEAAAPLYYVRNFGSGSAKIERQKQNYSGIYFAVQEKSSIFAPSRTCQAS